MSKYHLDKLCDHLALLALKIFDAFSYEQIFFLSSIEGQYLGPTPFILPEYMALRLIFFDIIL